MCFSAQASFIASGVLGIIGLYSLNKASRKQIPLALVPTLFSVQQAFEGIVWLTYANPAYAMLNTISVYGFCFFAFAFWPFWVPLTALLMEKDVQRKKLLQLLLILGSGVASFLVFAVAKLGIGTTVSCSHIKYSVLIPGIFGDIGAVLYCIATIAPFLVSSIRWMPLFGFLTLCSVGVTYFFYYAFFTSVWCFFAAALSAIIVFII